MSKINELYAWVIAIDDKEGIPAVTEKDSCNCPSPLVAASRADLPILRQSAQHVANHFNKPVKLMKSTELEIVEVVWPETRNSEMLN